ncbi:peroxidase 7-like [Malania oleifera]|uniref:peroxidase 7-like n=1 Tax=Malania oleifera TaxID=397392 RepID=UPI0025AE07E1|nr:peroxidase 7-like [Malania oleifera]
MNPSVSFIFLILIPAVLIHLTSASAQADDNYHEPPPETVAKGIPSSSTRNIPADQTPPEILPNYLSFNYSRNTCPDLKAVIHRKVNEWIRRDYSLAASLLRLHFHDCSVRGCDASILLNDGGSERTADASKTLQGFEVVDGIKFEAEKKWPKTVSCADILTSAARDATVRVGGPYWRVPYRRKDGQVSIAKEAERVPMGRETITDLIQFYQSDGLDALDLPVLSENVDLDASTPTAYDAAQIKCCRSTLGPQPLLQHWLPNAPYSITSLQPPLSSLEIFKSSLVNMKNINL